MEYQVVRKVAAMRDVVIDCGGGIVVDLDEQGMEQFSPRKVTLLRRCGQVLWLRGDPARITERIQHDPDRPVLDQRMAPDQIMLRRTPFYAQAAHHILDVEGKSCRALLREARRMLAPSQQSGNS
jgi:shikimate kinase